MNSRTPSNLLHRLTTLVSSKSAKWVIIGLWLVVVALAGPLAGKLQGAESNEVSAWLPGAAESTKALNIENTFISPNVVPTVVVYERQSGLTPADKARIAANPAQFLQVSRIAGIMAPPVFSKDGQAAQTVVRLDLGRNGWSEAAGAADNLRNAAKIPGVTVHITGPGGNAADSSKAFQGIDTTLLYAALGVVTVLLLITYRSPLLWLLPVISAGVALACAQAIIYLLAKHAGLTVNAQSAGILTVLVFGAATDYALLLIARYREELHNHEDRHEAMALALHRAAPAIIASAATVALGMLCLLAAQLNSTRGLGPVAAVGITVGVVSMLTLLPALLVVFGRWLFWPVIPRHGTEVPTSRGVWARIGKRIANRPRTVWLVTVLALGIFAIGIIDLHANGLSTKDSYRGTPDSVVGETVLANHFKTAGSGAPVIVVGNAPEAPALVAVLQNAQGVTGITSPVVKNGSVLIEATLLSKPDSQTAKDTIDSLRTALHKVPGADAKVGGQTAIQLDTERASNHDTKVIIPLMLAVVFVILAVLLRALFAPLVLVATVVLSFAATLGICAILFNHVFHFGGADPSFPLFVFVFLVALGIDYNIFLMTRVREESAKADTHTGSLIGLAATGAVITSAGAVLAGTFAVLATLPITAFTEIGFAVALGVLLDTFIVRSVLVTALTLDIGKRIWWPGKLYRKG